MSTNTLKQALEIVYGDIKNINKRVVNLESASAGVIYNETTKSAVAYQDNVSPNACPYALLNIVGGMSYKSENLVNIPNNTISSAGYLFNTPISSLGIGDYTVSLDWTGGGAMEVQFTDNTNTVVGRRTINNATAGRLVFTITTTDVATIIKTYASNTSGGTVSNIMLNKGSTALPYQPYFEGIRDSAVSSVISKDSNNTVLQTINIPQEIQALTGYGWGINDTCYNYIDLITPKTINGVETTKSFNKKVNRRDLGDFDWSLDGYNNWITPVNSIRANSAKALCSNYPIVASPENVDYGCKVGTALNRIVVHDKDTLSMTSQEFKEYVSGVYFYYELATPVETDISQYIDDNSIQVEANGTITFNNTYEQAIPYEYLYLEKVGANNE